MSEVSCLRSHSQEAAPALPCFLATVPPSGERHLDVGVGGSPWGSGSLSPHPYPLSSTGRGRVDVAGLVVGLTSGILVIVLAGLGAFWYLHWRRSRSQLPSPQE